MNLINKQTLIKGATDKALVDMYIAGEDDAFTELIERYKNLVFSIILRKIPNNELAQDLAQDVFIKIYKNLESYSESYAFSTWVMRIASNCVIDYYRKKKIETASIEDYEGVLQAQSTPESEYEKKEERELVNRLIEDLPEIYKLPLEMFHMRELSYTEIAERLGVPLSKVKNRIFKGRKILKEKILEANK